MKEEGFLEEGGRTKEESTSRKEEGGKYLEEGRRRKEEGEMILRY